VLLTKTVSLIAIIALLSASLVDAHANGPQTDKRLLLVLNQAKAGNYPAVLDAVDELDKQGKRADASLIALLDYYVGEGPSEIMNEAITRRGKRMLKALETKRQSDLQCLPEYLSVCMSKFTDGLKQRNEYIQRLEAAIRKGKVLRAVH